MGCNNSKDAGLLDDDMMDVMDNHEAAVRKSIVKKDSARFKKRGTFKVEQQRGGMQKKKDHELRMRAREEIKTAPEGIPTLVNWVLTPEGAVLGEVFEGLKNGDYHEGELIQTSEISVGVVCKEWSVVTTESGSKYFLGINDTDELPLPPAKIGPPSEPHPRLSMNGGGETIPPQATKTKSPTTTTTTTIPPPSSSPPQEEGDKRTQMVRSRAESEARLFEKQKQQMERAKAKRADIDAKKEAQAQSDRDLASNKALGNAQEKEKWAKNREKLLKKQETRVAEEKKIREQYEFERQQNAMRDLALTKEAQGIKEMRVGDGVVPMLEPSVAKPKRIKPTDLARMANGEVK